MTMASFRRIGVLLCDHDIVQHEPEDIPVVKGAPVGQGTPNVETGAVGLRVKTSGGGLSPPTPNSVEPNGMPTRPIGDPNPIPVGDEADDAGPTVEPPATPMQVPDALPIVPPPSKRADEPGVPVVDMALLDEVPGIEPPMPDDTCGSEPPMLEHVVMLPGAAPNGDVPDVIGLTPGVESSVAPIGIPVRGTAGAGPMPSGDVIPSGDPDGPMPPICADAEVLASATAVSIASEQPANLNKRAICNLHFFSGWTSPAPRPEAACFRPATARIPGRARRRAVLATAPQNSMLSIARNVICPGLLQPDRPLRRPKPACDRSRTAQRRLIAGCADSRSASARSPCETRR
jgi:hypothetical protein